MSEDLKDHLMVYRNPEENIELGEDPLHTFDLTTSDGEVIGKAEVSYFSKPFPFYQVNELYVEPEYQGEGNASRIMDCVEGFLKNRGKAGVLVDAIDEESPAIGMYARRGWELVPPDHRKVYAYNLPKDATVEQLRGYANRSTDTLSRESWMNKHKKK